MGAPIESSQPAELKAFHGRSELDEAIGQVHSVCEHFFMVKADKLDSDYFLSEEFSNMCGQIIRNDLNNRLLFLLENEDYFTRTNVRLITLARKFSSYIKIKILPKEYIDADDFFMIVDGSAYLHQPHTESFHGSYDLNDPGRCKHLSLRFKELWERSESPQELFTLGL